MTDKQRSHRLHIENNCKRLLDLMHVNTILPVVCINGKGNPTVGHGPDGRNAILYYVETTDTTHID